MSILEIRTFDVVSFHNLIAENSREGDADGKGSLRKVAKTRLLSFPFSHGGLFLGRKVETEWNRRYLGSQTGACDGFLFWEAE